MIDYDTLAFSELFLFIDFRSYFSQEMIHIMGVFLRRPLISPLVGWWLYS